MTTDATHLLKRLEPAVRPTGAPAPVRPAGEHDERGRFDLLLTLVSRGGGAGSPAVSVRDDAELSRTLDDDDRSRLASAADVAQRSGARRAVMLLDGRGLVMELPERVVVGELTAGGSAVRFDLDAAVLVQGEQAAADGEILAVPDMGVLRRELADLLSNDA